MNMFLLGERQKIASVVNFFFFHIQKPSLHVVYFLLLMSFIVFFNKSTFGGLKVRNYALNAAYSKYHTDVFRPKSIVKQKTSR